MGRERHSEEKIIYALKQADTGTSVKEICRQMWVSVPTFYQCKRKFQGLGITEVRRLKQLEDENKRLKQLVAHLTLDKHILQELIEKNFKACRKAIGSAVDLRSI